MKKFLFISLCIVILIGYILNSCTITTSPPNNPNNICHIFSQYPQWYYSAKKSRTKWGVPISVQMAIIYYESSYRAKARPTRKKLLFIIPWKHPTSAYGYSQAVNDTWKNYERIIGHKASRSNFSDTTDFIGWYAHQAKIKASISPTDAYHLYLAYHEGIINYRRGSYRNKPWLINVAKRVQSRANKYHQQLLRCETSLLKTHSWW